MESDLFKDFFELFPSELWVNVFQFLDAKELCTCQRVCRTFYKLSELDTLWSSLTEITFPNLPNKQEDMLWKDMYKALLGFDITGQWNTTQLTGFSLQHNVIKDDWEKVIDYAIPIVPHLSSTIDLLKVISPTHRKYLPQTVPTKAANSIITGNGRAPWGSFQVLGTSYGNCYWMLHIYDGYNFYTNYLLQYDMDKKSAKGVWKTNWQDLTGLCYSSPNHSLSTDLKLRFTDYINSKSDEDIVLVNKLTGAWDATFFINDKKADHNGFHYSFNITNSTLRGFSGVVKQRPGYNMLLGCVSDKLITMAMILVPEDYQKSQKIIGMIGPVIETKGDNIRISGKFVMQEGDITTGLFYALKSTGKRELHFASGVRRSI